MKRVAISQSNYIPWKGYFDLINLVDDFVLYDDVQYTKNDWRNRNIIKTQNGGHWLTIPIQNNKLETKIKETVTAKNGWEKKHWRTIQQSYAKAPYFKEFFQDFEEIYLNMDEEYLSKINYTFIVAINKILNINTNLHWSSDFKLPDDRNERLISICKSLNADVYVSGPAAKDYLDESLFAAENIDVEWMDYSGYPEHEQLFPPFEHAVTVLDLIFNTGPEATKYMKTFIS
ncbi:MAG: hypothetical protein DHS20C02_20040 [Micavibrio sp.]|nr:MAG: hypothetical protein DHS20C02_20040 [Micavibrio sp.]